MGDDDNKNLDSWMVAIKKMLSGDHHVDPYEDTKAASDEEPEGAFSAEALKKAKEDIENGVRHRGDSFTGVSDSMNVPADEQTIESYRDWDKLSKDEKIESLERRLAVARTDVDQLKDDLLNAINARDSMRIKYSDQLHENDKIVPELKRLKEDNKKMYNFLKELSGAINERDR